VAAGVRRIPGVDAAVAVGAGIAWLTGSRDTDGSALRRPPRGFAIPLDVAAADPRSYAAVTGFLTTKQIRSLIRGAALLGRTSARLRRVGPGVELALTTGRLRVGAVTSDAAVGAHEVLVSSARG